MFRFAIEYERCDGQLWISYLVDLSISPGVANCIITIFLYLYLFDYIRAFTHLVYLLRNPLTCVFSPFGVLFVRSIGLMSIPQI